MTGICGLLDPTQTASAAQQDLQAMQRLLPPHFNIEEEARADTYAVSCTALEHGKLFRNDKLLVIVDGEPRANDERFDLVNAKHIGELYDRHGNSVFEHIAGTFAVAIFDINQRKTLLAVDRTGTKPLSYSIKDNVVVFASTSTSVGASRLIDRSLDRQSLFNYIYFHMIPSPRTVFKEINKLAPAHMLIIENGNSSMVRYWQPSYQRQSKREIEGQLLPTLRSAVERAANQEPSGGFLSGGLDSSTVCGLLQQGRSTKADVFTIGFQQEGYDELEYAKLATGHFGLNLSSYYITPEDVLSAIPEVAKAYDEPFGNSSAVPTLVCARMAQKAGIKTLLAGDGGDELFGGNERYSTQKLFGYYDLMPKFLDKMIMRPIFFRDAVKRRDSGFQHKVRRYIEQANMAMPARTQNYNLLQLMGAENIFDADFLNHVNPQEPLDLLHAEYWQDDIPDQLERLLFMDYKFTLADNDLRKVNRMCELAGVQVKYPMLDDKVVEYSNTIPSSVKLKRMELRSFFKSEAKNFLPEQIINKSKHGFGLPFGEWLKLDKDLSDHINNNINSLRQRSIFDDKFIEDLQHRHQNQHAAYYGNLVWVMAMLEEWMQQHNLSV